MLRLGLIGWRGMVGSVLLQRMSEENDLEGIEAVFFSTSNIGGVAPAVGDNAGVLQDAKNVRKLAGCDVLISCQGGEYTTEIYGSLRTSGWKGFWIDAASTLRMDSDTVIVLDPVNEQVIRDGLACGLRTFAGGNCTVSLLLMAIGGLLQAGLVQWIATMTYQAASGAGASKMLELVKQMEYATNRTRLTPSENALEVEHMMTEVQRSADFPTREIGAPLAGSLIPWIDREMPGGQTREEWKGMAEANKIMRLSPTVPIDGICVRVGTMRCHSQALCIKLAKNVPLEDIEGLVSRSNQWVQVIPNDRESTQRCLTPTAVSGTLNVPIGRLHKLALGQEFLGAFTVGDQLLWGAAEPLRRVLRILREHVDC